jgi:hypothetical protein
MIIHCKNGLQVDTNPYIDFNEMMVLVGNKWIRMCELPQIDNEFHLYYLNFGSFIYLITYDTYQDIRRCYVIEQKLEKGHVKVENVHTSIRVGKSNTLEPFFRYNKEFERSNLTDYLSVIVDVSLSYMFDGKTLAEQIIDRLDRNNEIKEITEKPVEVTELLNKKSLSEIAREIGIPYNTLWNRVHRTKMTVEEAIAKGYNKQRGKKGGNK